MKLKAELYFRKNEERFFGSICWLVPASFFLFNVDNFLRVDFYCILSEMKNVTYASWINNQIGRCFFARSLPRAKFVDDSIHPVQQMIQFGLWCGINWTIVYRCFYNINIWLILERDSFEIMGISSKILGNSCQDLKKFSIQNYLLSLNLNNYLIKNWKQIFTIASVYPQYFEKTT